ncbi:MAG TPA: hypothetical protein VNQ77_04785 [Frankiaceae bacterium]|nr:hypothetical protein [Frankiaceae bacterium]
MQRVEATAAQLRDVVKAGKRLGLFGAGDVQGVLEIVRADHGIGSAAEYDLLDQDRWSERATRLGYEAFKSDKLGATRGGVHTSTGTKAFVTVATALVENALNADDPWPIAQVLWHEYEHVKQANLPTYPMRYRPDDAERNTLAEFEALMSEVRHALTRMSFKGTVFLNQASENAFTGAMRLALNTSYGLNQVEQATHQRDITLLGELAQASHQQLLALARRENP